MFKYISAQFWNHVSPPFQPTSDTHRLCLGMNFLKAPKLSLANYGKDIRSAPREVVFNRHVILSAIVYAMAAVPASKS